VSTEDEETFCGCCPRDCAPHSGRVVYTKWLSQLYLSFFITAIGVMGFLVTSTLYASWFLGAPTYEVLVIPTASPPAYAAVDPMALNFKPWWNPALEGPFSKVRPSFKIGDTEYGSLDPVDAQLANYCVTLWATPSVGGIGNNTQSGTPTILRPKSGGVRVGFATFLSGANLTYHNDKETGGVCSATNANGMLQRIFTSVGVNTNLSTATIWGIAMALPWCPPFRTFFIVFLFCLSCFVFLFFPSFSGLPFSFINASHCGRPAV
jgi:hypothetical protein